MRLAINIKRIFSLIILLLIVHSGQSLADKKIVLSSAERSPYIGTNLPNHGYVHELMTAAFERVGYQAEIKFFPLARAKHLAEEGTVDGLIPSYYKKPSMLHYVFSDPFPGDNIGLLKHKSSSVSYSVDPGKDINQVLSELQKYKFGVVRGASVTPAFDHNPDLEKQFVTKDLQNIDKLAAGRIDFAVIDKYTAADLLVNHRPHLIGQLEFMYPLLVSNSFHIAFSKKSTGYKERQLAFNEGLKAITLDGTLHKILSKHGLFPLQQNDNGKVKLTIGTVNNKEMIVMRSLSGEFEKSHPNIELRWRVLDENTLRQRLLSDLAISDGQFDIMTIGAYEAPIWAKRGWLTPLENLPESYDVQDILAPIRDALSYENKLYALPFYAESSMTFYRKDLFKKAGIKMSERPTYDDIKSYAAAIHNPDEQTYGICLRGKAGWGENMALISTMVNAYGGQWFAMNWKPKINMPAWKRAISTYKELLVNYGPPNPTLNGFNENRLLFSSGKCGIWIDATVAAGGLFDAQQSVISEHVGFAPAPAAITDKGASWIWTWAFAIPESSKNKQQAKQFITWATSKGYIEQVAHQHGWETIPPGTRKSTYQNSQYRAVAPFSEFVLKAIEQAEPLNSTIRAKPYTGIQFVGIPEFPAIGRQVGLKMVEVLKGDISIDNALLESQILVDEQMKSSGYY